MDELRDHERKTLSALSRLGGKAEAARLIEESHQPDAAVMRAALTLQEKNLVQIREKKRTVARLNAEGAGYAAGGLPERRMVESAERLGGKASLEKITADASLDKRTVPIALGWIQRKKWASFDGKTQTLKVLGKAEEGSDEKLVSLLNEKGHVVVDDLGTDLQEAFRLLRGRKLLEVEDKTSRTVEITEEGKIVASKKQAAKREITQLTPELIVSGKWRKASFQKYNIEAPVANTWPGKKQPYLNFLDQLKQKLVSLGFKEMTGSAVETGFFNFDALYTPQDHPAREAFDVYFIRSPKYGSIGTTRDVQNKVKETHENGWKTGSRGWRYQYSFKEAKRLLLRGHGTCLSARTLLSKDLDVPGRYFSLARCYRPDVLDRTHLTEFNQVEGIVIDENLNLTDLLGILTTFAKEIAGAEKVRLRPDYYPFTEPSVELSAYTCEQGWIEFGGSGIFRPEVTLPMGIDVPVIAWGLGVDRLFMMKAGISDIRELFSKDLEWLRRQKVT